MEKCKQCGEIDKNGSNYGWTTDQKVENWTHDFTEENGKKFTYSLCGHCLKKIQLERYGEKSPVYQNLTDQGY